jgi:hypothetical protein
MIAAIAHARSEQSIGSGYPDQMRRDSTKAVYARKSDGCWNFGNSFTETLRTDANRQRALDQLQLRFFKRLNSK